MATAAQDATGTVSGWLFDGDAVCYGGLSVTCGGSSDDGRCLLRGREKIKASLQMLVISNIFP